MTTVGLPDWRAYQEPSVPLEKKTVTGGRGSSLGLGSRDIVSVRSGLSRPYTARSVALSEANPATLPVFTVFSRETRWSGLTSW